MDPTPETSPIGAPQPEKPRVRPAEMEDGSFSYRTQDSYSNFLTRTGTGTPNISGGGHYRINPISRDRMTLEWIYRGNWVARTIVDSIADDMTREGVEIQSEDEPEDLEKLNKGAEALQIWTKLGTTIKWSRLYGGALGYLMIDGHDPSTPLDIDTIKEGQFKGILPLDRWMAWPISADIIGDLTPEFGQPRYYTMWPDVGTNLPTQKIHHSRVIKLDGLEIPYWQRISENYWGLSVLEPIWDRIMAFDSITQGAAQLVYKAHLRTIKVKGLRALLGTNAVASAALKKFFDFVRVYQSNEGMTLLDSEDEFDLKTYSFAGLADMMLQFAQQLGGSEQIPMVRFFGQSPSGMNSTGESDWRNYFDGIKARQERVLRPGVEKIYALLYRSVLGRKPTKVYTLNFRPLWQMTDEQSAAVTGTVATAVAALVDKNIYTLSMALRELRQLSSVTNFGSNITDDDIKDAETLEKELRENPPEPGDGSAGSDAGRKSEGHPGAKSRTNDGDSKPLRVAAS